MDVKIFVTRGLGDNSYLVVDGKEAVLVDPQRDFWRFAELIDDRDYKLRYVLETHVHNDYISGSLELKDRYKGVELALPKGGEYEFEHKGMRDGDSISIGNTEFQVMHTPGHTYEHISWIANNGVSPVGAFTGGSLIVGSAGRTDLLGHDHTDKLTKLQHESIEKLKQFPDDMRIYPTHGSGSFCTSSNASSQRISTLGQEKKNNQALTVNNLEEFLDRQLSGLMEYPAYYKHMAPLNRKGPKVYGKLPIPRPMDVNEFETHMSDATVVDIRHGTEFAKSHIPGSLNFQFATSAANYIGWTLPFNETILVVGDGTTDHIRDVTTQLFRIGYENVIGYLNGGIDAWIEEGKSTRSYEVIRLDKEKPDLSNRKILDVRQPVEREAYKLPQSKHMFIGNLTDSVSELHEDEYTVICESGQRAAAVASYLEKLGKKVSLVTNGGVSDIVNHDTS